MAHHLLNNLQLAKQQASVLGGVCLKNGSLSSVAKYSTIVDEEPRQLKTVNLTSLKRGTGGRSSFNGMVVTIFGATGFLGPMVGYKFGKLGSQLIYPYRADFYPAMRLKPTGDLGQVLFHFYNLRDEKSIKEAMKYSNVVVNLVGRQWETRNFTFDDVHVDGARLIAKCARECGVERLIHLSAMNVTPDPEAVTYFGPSKWLKSKYYGEQAVFEEFPNATVIRPADMYGREDHFLWYYQHVWRRQFRAVPLWDNGDKTVKAPVFGGDIAQAIVNAAKDPETAGKIYQGVGPHRYLLSDIIDYLYRVMNKDLESWGYFRYNMKYDPFFYIKTYLTEKLSQSNPVGEVNRERVEKEFISDVILDGVPTLEDLGVNLTLMDDQIPYEMKAYTAWLYYHPEPGEFAPIGKPRPLGKYEYV
ncbi:NADH dehydrogenase [ubiquinone] 1 alpha subcomplex subunit 9, mitochondrial [Contarinia nasturtii]|uniref:NADH dehydrogenase [ubiquinone] 1 alpha subcomplex subunit 9, mitochondrial n=1 Tax=Contarinia nasturtii TaxID=265458 RepID=UPI0012D3BD7C|nr:NADH dehydrogenase [ubiquinone] 1 alpha subcomplex subunit 9, mitochondrial [Contarinia nasturtii]